MFPSQQTSGLWTRFAIQALGEANSQSSPTWRYPCGIPNRSYFPPPHWQLYLETVLRAVLRSQISFIVVVNRYHAGLFYSGMCSLIIPVKSWTRKQNSSGYTNIHSWSTKLPLASAFSIVVCASCTPYPAICSSKQNSKAVPAPLSQ